MRWSNELENNWGGLINCSLKKYTMIIRTVFSILLSLCIYIPFCNGQYYHCAVSGAEYPAVNQQGDIFIDNNNYISAAPEVVICSTEDEDLEDINIVVNGDGNPLPPLTLSAPLMLTSGREIKITEFESGGQEFQALADVAPRDVVNDCTCPSTELPGDYNTPQYSYKVYKDRVYLNGPSFGFTASSNNYEDSEMDIYVPCNTRTDRPVIILAAGGGFGTVDGLSLIHI